MSTITNEEVTFRLAEHEDLPRIVAIYNQNIASHTVTADTAPVTVAAREDWFWAHTPKKWPMWVAELNGEVVGWVSLSQFKGRAAYDRTAEISIYIDHGAQGHHVGTAAVRWAEKEAPKADIAVITSLIIGANAVSLALFAHLGYEQWGKLPAVMSFSGTLQDLVILGKVL